MKRIFVWLWDGENVAPRLLAVILAGASYVTGASWNPHDPIWIAGAVGCLAAAAMSKPTNGVPNPGRPR